MTLVVLPLQLEEEDADIWQKLTEASPEEQQAVIKEALRQFFGFEKRLEQDSSVLTLESLFSHSGYADRAEEKKALKPWERLLNEVVGLEEDESVIAAIQALQSEAAKTPEDAANISEATPKAAPESQASTFDAFRSPEVKHEAPKAENEPVYPQLREALDDEKGLSPVLKGMAHLMQVIGDEEDEELLDFLQRSG